MDHRTEFFSVEEFQYDAERDVYVCPTGKELHFFPAHSTERSRRYRARAKDCNHCPRHPRSVRPVYKDAASAAVSMKPVWNGCVPISPPQPTKKPCASVRSGWNHSSRDQQRLAWHAPFSLTTALACELRSTHASRRAKSQALAPKTGMGTAALPSRSRFPLFLAAFGWFTRRFSEYGPFSSPMCSDYSMLMKERNCTLLMSLVKTFFNSLLSPVTCRGHSFASYAGPPEQVEHRLIVHDFRGRHQRCDNDASPASIHH